MIIIGKNMTNEEAIKEAEKLLYTVYCKAVGGVAFNGDPLPRWEEFESDKNKQLQVQGWKTVALEAYNFYRLFFEQQQEEGE